MGRSGYYRDERWRQYKAWWCFFLKLCSLFTVQNYCKYDVRHLLWDERRGDKRNRRRQDVKERWKNNGGGGGGRATEEQHTAETMKRRAM